MGKLNFFFGLQVKQTPKGTMISQQKYINELLKRFDMEGSKIIDTPIATNTRQDMDEPGSSVQSNPKESHLKAAKRILRYLKGTQDLVLYYPSRDNFDLIGYVDVDYVGYLVDRKSTSGMAHFLGSCLISWGTRKQNSVALSTVEAEYMAGALAVLNCCGLNSSWKILVCFLIACPYYVTIPILSTWLRIQFNIREQSILMCDSQRQC
ncbi:uncharacterized mitochondrial protein AtMg00810-like [Nicotiana sylvestris]|uniref:uncharacterized mitochondrial protein AtMg00810-like n=1 Tax=Nicotiana sylvestris TaxID=4096 RepID=UPI00388C8B6B